MSHPSFRSSTAFIIFSISSTAFTETFLYGLIIPLLPFTLSTRSSVAVEDVQKWVSILLAMYGIGSLLGSFLTAVAAKYIKLKTAYSAGLVALVGSTAAFAFGRNVYVLMAGRACQGLAAASVWTVGLVILTQAVDQKHSARAMGYVNAAAALGYMSGPPLAGVVYDQLGYYPVFGAASLLLLFDVYLRLAMIVPESDAKSDSAQGDQARREASVEESASRHYSGRLLDEQTSLLPTQKSGSASSWPLFVLLGSPKMLALLLVCANEHVVLTGLEAVLPVYVKELFGWPASMISLLFVLLVLPTLFSPLVGYVSDKLGVRPVVTFGLAITAIGIICLRFVSEDSTGHIVILMLLISIIGVGVAMLLTPVTAGVGGVVERLTEGKDRSYVAQCSTLAFGLINSVMMLAGIIGPASCGALVDLAGWGTLTVALGAFCAISGVVTFICL